MAPVVFVSSELEIPLRELEFHTSRSAGPGGQNVNKVSTRITLLFDVQGSPSLNQRQRALLQLRLKNRISRRGLLQLSCQEHRTLQANRKAVLERFQRLLRNALRIRRQRRPTRAPSWAIRRRLESKRRRGELKRRRSRCRTRSDPI